MTFKNAQRGFCLLESLITLVILSTSIMMMMNVGLTQIRQIRDDLQLNQLHMQVDALSLLISQEPLRAEAILLDWQENLKSMFPHAVIQSVVKDGSVNLHIKLDYYCLQVVSSVYGSQKKLSRNDAG